MNKFKIGDRVKRTYGEFKGMKVGDVGIVKGLAHFSCVILEGYDGEHDMDKFKLVDEKESTSAWLKENKWFIRTGNPEKSKLVQEWLFNHDCQWLYGKNVQSGINEELITNTNCMDVHEEYILFSTTYEKTNAQEITLEFETVVKSAKLPEVAPKPTEQELRIIELEATISKAQEQVKKIKEEM